jgi:hypothetical protein
MQISLEMTKKMEFHRDEEAKKHEEQFHTIQSALDELSKQKLDGSLSSSSISAGGADGATVSLYAASLMEGAEDKVKVSGGTVVVSSVGSTEVSSKLVSLESTDSVVRASSGLA